MPKQYSSDVKLLAVKHYINVSNNLTETCKIFKCSRRSLNRWIERYNKTGNVIRNNRNTKSYKVRSKHVKFIIETVKKYPEITMKDLLAKN